jgi:hypothetical protein
VEQNKGKQKVQGEGKSDFVQDLTIFWGSSEVWRLAWSGEPVREAF